SILGYVITGANAIRLVCEEIISRKPLRHVSFWIDSLFILCTLIEFILDKLVQMSNFPFYIFQVALTCCQGLYGESGQGAVHCRPAVHLLMLHSVPPTCSHIRDVHLANMAILQKAQEVAAGRTD